MPCSIPVVIHSLGQFSYGELVDLSLGGSRLAAKSKLNATQFELTPHRTHLDRASIIPLPYKIAWQSVREDGVFAGLQFTGGIDAFFRGWIADYLHEALPSHELLLAQETATRVSCQLDSVLRRECGAWLPSAVLGLSIVGVTIATARELFPGESFSLNIPDHPELEALEIIVLSVRTFDNFYLCETEFLELSRQQHAGLESALVKLTKR